VKRFCLLLLSMVSLPAEGTEYWVYRPNNLLVESQRDETISLLQRAGKAGYTHCLITDSKFCRLAEMPEKYSANVAKVKAAAVAAGIELVPAVCPVGYANDLLFADPNLIEGLPVRDCPMVVKDGEARVEADPVLQLKGGDFSGGPKGWAWHDETVFFEDGAAVSRDPQGKNSRLSQEIHLQPWRQYHISVRVRSRDYKGTAEVKVLAGEQSLQFDYLKVEPTQEWTTHHVVFNSQEHTGANLYLGCWDGTTGELWWDDVRLEERPLVNLVRRGQAPLHVRTAAGKELKEGTDFEPLQDPLLGTQPYPGCYTVFHEPPALKTKLPAGTRLLVSYYHGVTVHDGQANLAVSEPRALELLEDQVRRVHALFQARRYFMSHDEIRVFNWSELPNGKKLTAGQLLADNVRWCAALLRRINPGGKIYVWGDMFDPGHNARDHYYLVQGDYAGSWEGLDRDIIVVPWAFELRDKSMAFFAKRGHHQLMAGYYDSDPAGNAQGWMESGRKTGNVEGIMYTTWQQNYSELERFIEAAKQGR